MWAEENTHEAIFDALKRKEVFATSGTRVQVRFFGGWNYASTLSNDPHWLRKSYTDGVPMGGDLPAKPAGAKAPQFVVWAMKDPDSAPLQRIQVIKAWLENGESKEQIFDVACSDKLRADPKTHRCPDNGATVNLTDCSIPKDKGAVELHTVWADPTFDPRQRAFYYARVIENPVCRWNTWDAIRYKLDLPRHVAATIQERAWSSPIWYTPGNTERSCWTNRVMVAVPVSLFLLPIEPVRLVLMPVHSLGVVFRLGNLMFSLPLHRSLFLDFRLRGNDTSLQHPAKNLLLQAALWKGHGKPCPFRPKYDGTRINGRRRRVVY